MPKSIPHLNFFATAAAALLSCGQVADAATKTAKAGDGAQAAKAVQVFLDTHCTNCHDAAEKKGGLDLEALKWQPEKRENFDEWVKVVNRVSKGDMPPPKKPHPDAAALKAFLSGLETSLHDFDAKREATNGRAILRRLNRFEYENTMHDLLGIATPLARVLPADTPAHGFDTVAEDLRFSTLQMEKYLETADLAIDAALEFGPEPERSSKRYFAKDEKGVRYMLDKPETEPAADKSGKKHKHVLRELPDAIVYFNEGYPSADMRQFSAKVAGKYRIRISAYGYQSKGQQIPMRVYTDNYREKQLLGWFEMPPDAPRVVEFTATLPAHINLRIEPSETGVDEKGQNVYNTSASTFTGAGLALQWVEVEGPLLETWPPASMKNLFGDTPLTKVDETKKGRDKRIAYELTPADPRVSAKAAIERFAGRAFRRPLEVGEADRFVKLATDELDAGRPFIEATRVGFRAVLAAPQFLLFDEPGSQASRLTGQTGVPPVASARAQAGSPRALTGGTPVFLPPKLDDYALASRLSYFLWSTMPDEALLAVAAGKKLSQPAVLCAQVERMLKDEKAHAFVENFTGQWLDLRNIDATSPDMRLYPEFDERLRAWMVQETESFFSELLNKNLGITNLIHSDFAMLNSRLAAHYQIDGVDGEAIRKVALPPDSQRGGLLTQASILKVSANGTTTSPVLRGIWVMKRLLGQPPQPPPQNTGTIEPDTRGATTVREQLAKHRSMESCAGCHATIDPPGFALESFDVIGGWRVRYRSQGKGDTATVPNTRSKRKYIKLGPPVDASGDMPDGRHFDGIQDFKKILLTQSDQVLAALTKNLITYSTGAPIGFADRRVVDEITAKVKQQGGGVRTLIHEIVQSPIFQTK